MGVNTNHEEGASSESNENIESYLTALGLEDYEIENAREHCGSIIGIKKRLLDPIEGFAEDAWITVREVTNNEFAGRVDLPMEKYCEQMTEALVEFAKWNDSTFILKSDGGSLEINFNSQYSISEYSREERINAWLADYEAKFLQPIAYLSDDAMITFSRFPHDGDEQATHEYFHMTAGEFRRKFAEQAAKIVDPEGGELYLATGVSVDGKEKIIDLTYHDHYDIREYTKEQQIEDAKILARLEEISQIEKLGVPRELFSGVNNYWHHDEDGNQCAPVISPTFSPEDIVKYAAIIQRYLLSKKNAE